MFFSEYRKAISNCRFYDSGKSISKEPEPWKNKAEYLADVSSKWRVIFDLLKNILRSDDPPFPQLKEGSREIVLTDRPIQADAKSKVVLYLEFTSLEQVLLQVSHDQLTRVLAYRLQAFHFELGMTPLMATGRTHAKKRSEAVKKFMTDDKERVLVLSSVGNAGLNLHAAQFLIFIVSVVAE